MSTKPASVEKIDVTLIRQGVGREEFRLPEGATVSTLLQEAGTRLEDGLITIDGIPLAELVALQPGMIVTLAPRSETSPLDDRWRETIGMFHGDQTFQEMVEAIEANREAEKDRS